MAWAQAIYKDKVKLYKINKMRMLKHIVYTSEITGELYNYYIQFLKLIKTRSIEFH